MDRRLSLAAAAGSLVFLVIACRTPGGDPPQTGSAPYTPTAVFCADGSGKLCGVMPSMVGPDPALHSGFGYKGLSDQVSSAEGDVQTPFDNFSWQSFVALNQITGGPFNPRYVWQSYHRAEEVFGAGPGAPCSNSFNLPVFSIISKSGGQPPHEGFIQAATDSPLIDRNGNWTLYERRLNTVERRYLERWNLTTLAGQQSFVEAGHKVDFTASADATHGAVGAVELKMAWRILRPDLGDDPSRFITLKALLAVDKADVRDGTGPICTPVQLGLVGFHIIQKNPQRGALLPQWIWATFEHQDNVPLSPNACDPVKNDCYARSNNPAVCTAPTQAPGRYSYFNASCPGGDCPVNQPPALLPGEKTYRWSPQQPYAQAYLAKGRYGTQAARCWQIYSLTQALNTQWRGKLAGAHSVLANYMLIGTQWGGNVEPTPGGITNGGVPAFLANSTLETYIQTDKNFGTCLGCHASAQLAYTQDGGKKTYDANFSFLLGLAH